MIRLGNEIWLCLHFPELALAALTDPAVDRPLAVIERQRLHVVNAAARVQGLSPGQGLANGYALCPDLLALERQPQREQQTLEQLACWGYGLVADISSAEGNSLLLEVGACRRLYGGLSPLLQRLASELEERGHVALAGVAHTPKAAWLLAHSASNAATWSSLQLRPEQLEQQLGEISVAMLPVPPSIRTALEQMGIHTVQALLALPLSPLGKRFGVDFVRYLQRLTGHAPDPQPSFMPAPHFEHSLAFLDGIHDRQILLFPMKRLIGTLCDYLRARQLQCRALQWRFFDAHTLQAELVVELSQAGNGAATFFDLSRLRLDQLNLAEPVFTLQLLSQAFSKTSGISLDLFDDDPQASRNPSSKPAELLDRLSARLGDRAIQRLAGREQHWPELAWQRLTLHEAHRQREVDIQPPSGPRPMWLLPTPLRLRWRQQQLFWREPLELIRGPERITQPWWQSNADPRDYYVACLPDGSRCWVFQEGESDRWFLHGWFA